MEEYRKVLPLKMPDEQERKSALGSLIGEKYTLKKTFTALQDSKIFEPQEQQGPGEWMFENEVEEQTFPLYSSSFINYLEEGRKTIYIVKLDCSIPADDFKLVKKSIKAFFQGCTVKVLKQKWKLDINNMGEEYSEKYDLKLYDSQKMLRQMQQHIPKDAYCMIGLTDHHFYNLPSEKSLFSCPIKLMNDTPKLPEDWMIFGLASVKDRVGIVNYKRFIDPISKIPSYQQEEEEQKNKKNKKKKQQQEEEIKDEYEQYREIKWKDIPEEVRLRICNFEEDQVVCSLVKVINHEICHMFGIRHCVHYKCIMNGSSYRKFGFKDFKNKPFDLCVVCLRKLQFNMGFDVQERYLKMANACESMGEPFEKYSYQYRELYDDIEKSLKYVKQQQQPVQKKNSLQSGSNIQKEPIKQPSMRF